MTLLPTKQTSLFVYDEPANININGGNPPCFQKVDEKTARKLAIKLAIKMARKLASLRLPPPLYNYKAKPHEKEFR